MTTVSLKLVGNNQELLFHINKSQINILDVFSYLMEKGLSFDEISKIMFVHKGKNISDDINTIYIGTNEDPLIIHMFSNQIDIRDEIIKCIFSNIHNSDTESESEDDNEELSPEELDKNNLKTIELFSDKDFTYLLKICLNKPELLNKVSNYINHGNITTEIKEIKEEDFKYQKEELELEELLKKLDININTMAILHHFEGNINLSLRYIITKGINNHKN